MTAAEVARYLRTTERYVWSLGRRNVLPRVVLPGGRLVRFRRADVEAMLAAQQGPPATERPAPRPPRRPFQDGQTSMRF